MHINQLSEETSPYLLQHKNNPVQWYPWGETALNKARQENRPILLSIGYSACHWCHVMAHESFEDEHTAKIMNELFINIKVDREERPDLDKIYQTTHSLLTQRSGGWPLTMFLTPDEHMPFFAGTYFPNEPRHGMPAFSEILHRVADAYKNNQESIQQQNIAIQDVFKKISDQDNIQTDTITALPIDVAKNQLKKNFDSEFGGFGNAPKFPHPSNIELALRLWTHSVENKQEDFDLLNTATFTLKKMAEGGIFDQLGGGFCRYSVDNKWQIPHFEKMLYDNGPLLTVFAQAHTIIETPLFEDTTIKTANWIIREMQSKNGGYYSSLDADSEDKEGKFYVWNTEEIKQHIKPEQYTYFSEYYGLNMAPNFEEKYWNLTQTKSLEEISTKYDIEIHQLHDSITQSSQLLFEAREKRIRPDTDDKILTSWNALMIKGMSVAGRVFEEPAFIESASNAYEFIKNNLWKDNLLFATHKDGKTQLSAYLDDYAYLLDATLELLQSNWQADYLIFTEQLANRLVSEFEDKENGGFYFTAHQHENLIMRQKNYADDAMPSGNGIAILALLKLGYLLANTHYLAVAEKAIKASFHNLAQAPLAHATLTQALDTNLNHGITSIIIRGDKKTARQWQSVLNKKFIPHVQHFYIADEIKLPEALADKKTKDKACAYICQGMSCLSPVFSIEDILKSI